jgi:hypothetical protein
MDYLDAKKTPPAKMKILNACRIYLKAITLSDITSADGTYILDEAKSGAGIPHRRSSLDWPEQGKPMKKEWEMWAEALSSLDRKKKLINLLKRWLHSTHQTWEGVVNLGGRKKGSTKSSKSEESEKEKEALFRRASLYKCAIDDAKKLGHASFPNGTLKSIVLAEEEKLGLSVNSISLHTVRSRVNRGNLGAFNLN